MEQGQQLNIQLDKTLPLVCENCGNDTFQEALFLRKVSKFLTASTKDSLLPIPTFTCARCHYVNNEFIPEPLKPQTEENAN